MVSLWDLVTLFSGCTALGAAIAAAKSTGTGGNRIVIGSVVGALIAIACVSAVRAAGRHVFLRMLPGEEGTVRESKARLVYLAAAVWIVLSGILAAKAALFVVRLTLS